MIRNATNNNADSIHGNRTIGADGEIGTTTDVLFDDHTWTVRYLAVYVEGGLESYQTLITPQAISTLDRQDRSLHVEANADSIRQAPHLEANLPVAAQQEVAYHSHLGATPYWEGDPMEPLPASEVLPGEAVLLPASGDPHLRSAQEVVGYSVETADGSTGHVEDLLLDDESWRIRYLVVDTRDWLPARKVLLPLSGVSQIDWAPRRVSVDLGSRELKEAPAWDPEAPLDREYEARLHEHYGVAPYWVQS